MNKPVLFIVDDDPQMLNTVGRDLRAHYHGDYRIAKAALSLSPWSFCTVKSAR